METQKETCIDNAFKDHWCAWCSAGDSENCQQNQESDLKDERLRKEEHQDVASDLLREHSGENH